MKIRNDGNYFELGSDYFYFSRNKNKDNFKNISVLRVLDTKIPINSGIHAPNVSELFSITFRCYKDLNDKDLSKFLLENTASILNLSIERMMKEVENLYNELLETNPELFI